jgi:hypothetical protein
MAAAPMAITAVASCVGSEGLESSAALRALGVLQEAITPGSSCSGAPAQNTRAGDVPEQHMTGC